MNTDSLTQEILGAVLEVSSTLGAGFLEIVYRRALLTELRIRGLSAVPEVPFGVVYKGERIGKYFADILVEDTIVIELKCADHLYNDHLAQSLNYLQGYGHE